VCSLLRRVDRRDRLDGLLRARIEGSEQHIEEPDPNLVLAGRRRDAETDKKSRRAKKNAA